MFRKIVIIIFVALAVIAIYIGYIMLTTKSHSPADVASFSFKNFEMNISYCRPYKKGRTIFGNENALIPFGKKWRTGANEATEISFNSDISILGNTLPAGRYSIYTIPNEDVWTVAFNSKVGYWGANPSKDPFEEQYDVLRIKIPVRYLPDSVIEQFTISFDKPGSINNIIMSWDNTQIIIPFEIMKD